MTIQLNGEQHEVEFGISVAVLLQHFGVRLDQVAVEVNLEVVDKSGFETCILKNGDQVEVMSFMGGGSGVSSLFQIISGDFKKDELLGRIST